MSNKIYWYPTKVRKLASIDISRAYENVSHTILLRKLRDLKTPAILLTWIGEFLTNRSFRIKWKSTFSTIYSQSRGLPQGIVLSPILFSLYTSDLGQRAHPQTSIFLYADDICILSSSHHKKTAVDYLSDTLTGMTKWAKDNQMTFSPSKSGILNLSRRRLGTLEPFLLQDRPLPLVSKIKFLGVVFQESLKWNEHLSYLKTRTLKRISLLRFIGSPQWGLSSHQLLRIMSLTILPVLTYACQITFSAPNYFQVGIERLHSEALRACLGVPRQTPLSVLRCISGQHDLKIKILLINIKFLLRHLALGTSSPLYELLDTRKSLEFYHWGSNNYPIGFQLLSLEQSGDIQPALVRDHNFLAQTYLPRTYEITLNSLPFQRKDLPLEYIAGTFSVYIAAQHSSTILIGTDAARRNNRSAIGVVTSTGVSISYRIHNDFSVFSAEALAILMGISSLSITASPIIIFSDSRSVLSALAKVKRTSHTLILELHQLLTAFSVKSSRIQVVWVPGHSGIIINEVADQLAVQGLKSMDISDSRLPWTDIFRTYQQRTTEKVLETWFQSPYSSPFSYLRPLHSWCAPAFLPRRMEILIQRLRTKTLTLNENLCRWRISPSPDCDHCGAVENTEHFLLTCPHYKRQRLSLMEVLRLSPPVSLHDILNFVDENALTTRIQAVWLFLRETHRF